MGFFKAMYRAENDGYCTRFYKSSVPFLGTTLVDHAGPPRGLGKRPTCRNKSNRASFSRLASGSGRGVGPKIDGLLLGNMQLLLERVCDSVWSPHMPRVSERGSTIKGQLSYARDPAVLNKLLEVAASLWEVSLPTQN